MIRIQRTRKAGDKLPPNTLCVTRGTLFGNPFPMQNEADRDRVVIEFREWVNRPEQDDLRREFIERCKKENKKHIACWCSLESPCHGDVWIEVWNHDT